MRSCRTAASESGAIETAVREQSIAKKANLGESATIFKRARGKRARGKRASQRQSENNRKQDDSLRNGGKLK